MGYFVNIRALNEGEIILSKDRYHLYQVAEGKLIECEKIIVPSDNQDLWQPDQKHGASIFDSTKQVVYIYNIEKSIWEELEYGSYNTDYISNLNAYNAVLKLYEVTDKLPKNMHI